ncbi:hypothetical protein J541_0596 [Acinetobacter pittii]|nr:hypothetical protein J541_0596 [Acinetobacter pittii]
MVLKNYADAEGLLYRQNDKLLRLIQFVQKNMLPTLVGYGT